MSEEMKMSDYFNLPIEQGDVMRINQYCTVEQNNDGVAPFDAAIEAINNYDRLVEENARLTELAAQKASRADELFNMLERLVSQENCRKDVIHLMGEAESLLDKIKQESNDE